MSPSTPDGNSESANDDPGSESEPRSYPQGFFVPAPGASQVLLIRHGQSAPYVSGRPFPLVDGHGDPELSELGHFQAARVAGRLVGEPISAIYVSTLTRTQQTAAPLAKALELEPRIEPDVREVFLGEAEGGLLREMFATDHPTARALRASREWGVIPGAETNAEFGERTVGAVSRIAARHRDEMVAVFCHGGVIAAVLQFAARSGPGTFFGARHTSVNHLVIQDLELTDLVEAPDRATDVDSEPDPSVTDGDRHWIIRCFNDAAHAGGLTGDDLP